MIGGSLGVHLEARTEAKASQNVADWLAASGPCSASFLTKPSTTSLQWVGPSVPISNRENAHRPLWQRLFLKGGEVPSSQLPDQ